MTRWAAPHDPLGRPSMSSTRSTHMVANPTIKCKSIRVIVLLCCYQIKFPHARWELILDFNKSVKQKRTVGTSIRSAQSKFTCPSTNDPLSYAITSFWGNGFETSYNCSIYSMSMRNSDGLSIALLYYSFLEGNFANSEVQTNLPRRSSTALQFTRWEILGPMTVSKLEVDADPTFYDFHQSNFTDHIQYLLTLRTDNSKNYPFTASKGGRVLSELSSTGYVAWRTIKASPNAPHTDISFPGTHWNNLYRGLHTESVIEFQAWARSTIYAPVTGAYKVHCLGVHSIYIRNNKSTMLVTGDVYRDPSIPAATIVRLKEGMVGLVLPLRGVAQTSFSCTLTAVFDTTKSVQNVEILNTITVSAINNIPHIVLNPKSLQSRKKSNSGILLSRYFSVNMQSLDTQDILKIIVTLKVPKPLDERISVRPVISPILLVPGHLTSIPMELYNLSTPDEDKPLTVPCTLSSPLSFFLQFSPSKGDIISVKLSLECRKVTQSFLVTYLDHDGSVAHTAVVLPLPLRGGPGIHLQDELFNTATILSTIAPVGYPFVLTLHGTGLSSIKQADAYKYMPAGRKDYIFGIKGTFVIAPGRKGAHNWEMVGDYSARRSVGAVRRIMRHAAYLGFPQLSYLPGIIAGHSMGGHGAWIVGSNNPDLAYCLSPAASWIRKEEYGTANKFFEVDIQNSYVQSGLKRILEMSMSEFHSDVFAPPNLRTHDVHIRVGGADMTASAWFSRRMFRLLQSAGVTSSYEELPDKEHWWWDTADSNDGGALNDPIMRQFYENCRLKHTEEANSMQLQRGTCVDTTTFSGTMQIKISPEITQAYLASRCAGSFSIRAVNIGAHTGMCGIRVLQQFQYMLLSTVDVDCYSPQSLYGDNGDERKLKRQSRSFQKLSKLFSKNDSMEWKLIIDEGVTTVCFVHTENIRRLRIQTDLISINKSVVHYINGCEGERGEPKRLLTVMSAAKELGLNSSVANLDFIDLCWSDADCYDNTNSRLSVSACHCSIPLDPLLQRVPETAGPVRHVYARPVIIVYGSQALRSSANDFSESVPSYAAMRDLAIYIANSHLIAHDTFIRLMSDVDYLRQNSSHQSKTHNLILIGGPSVNKAFEICLTRESRRITPPEYTKRFSCASPVTFDDSSNGSRFNIGKYHFTDSEALLFTLPLSHRPSKLDSNLLGLNKAHASYAMCLHASSIEGYHSLARLAWPVVPPMVRAPFAAYIADYVVLTEQGIWSKGLGAVLLAGYWNSTWQVDTTQQFAGSSS